MDSRICQTFTASPAEPGDLPCLFSGAGVRAEGVSPILENCIIRDNRAEHYGGGALYRNTSAPPVILNCEFRNNTAGTLGDGLYINTKQPVTIRGCKFVENDGYGALIYYNKNVQIEDCQFIRNKELGLGLSVQDASAVIPHVNIVNCLFSGNPRGLLHGGRGITDPEGSWDYRDTASYVNCTFVANTRNDGGSAMKLSGLVLTIKNCILWQNAGLPYYSAYPYVFEVTWSNSIIQEADWTTDNHAPRPVGEGLMFDVDPQFIAPALGNYRLHPSSPAIDMGSAVDAPATDLDGNPRPIDIAGIGFDGEGLGHDIGAYEYDPATFKDPYDPNADGATNALDIQEVINAALGLSSIADTDINDDGITNALDIQLIINAALGIY